MLQNKTLRLRTKTRRNENKSTSKLLEECNELSVNQLAAYHTLLGVHRAVRAGKPQYLHQKLTLNIPSDNQIFPQRHLNTIVIPNSKLTLSRAGFCFRGATLWNKLPGNIRGIEKYTKFKNILKKWIRKEIPDKAN